MTLGQKVGGYLFQNTISFEEEIVTYIKGGWVSNTDVTISYIHILFFFLHISTFMEKRGQWKWNFFCWTPPLDFMEIELDNTEDKLCFKTLLNIMLKFLLVILRDKLLLKMRFHIQLFNQWEHWEIWSWPTTCFMKLALQLSLLHMCSYLITVSTSANKLAGALALTTNM